MAVTSYATIDGEILSEKRAGTDRDYLPDPLGSTAALLDGAQAKTDTFAYWPYGEVRTSAGTTATPFRFVGSLGYYRDSAARTYVRARTYQQTYGRWVSTDESWSDQPAYAYCVENPTTSIDSFGHRSQKKHKPGRKQIPHPRPISRIFVEFYTGVAFTTCFDPATADLLGRVFICLAYAESSGLPNAIGAKGYGAGLFQLASNQFDACHTPGCCGKYFDPLCNTIAAANLLMHLCGSHPGQSIWEMLGVNWGVVPAQGRPEQNEKFLQCVSDSKIKQADLEAIRCPANCPSCNRFILNQEDKKKFSSIGRRQ